MTLFSLNSLASATSNRLVAATKAAGPSNTSAVAASTQTANRGADAVELSGLFAPDASAVAPGSSSNVGNGKPIRGDLVARIKSQIDSGIYDLDSKKLDKVATGILRDINLQG